MSAEYGQKRWNSVVFRYSAISGTLLDENEEGLAGYEVLAYRNSNSPEFMAHATSDVRGIYRLHGLPPGTYMGRPATNRTKAPLCLLTRRMRTD